jgi:hypothetical protein
MIVLFHVIPERGNPESEISRKRFISSELLARLTDLNSTADAQQKYFGMLACANLSKTSVY